MFWGWRRAKAELKPQRSLQALATQLGVERRQFVRVRYPFQSIVVCKLPEIHFHGKQLIVKDISVGGCCLLDPDEVMGPAVGQDIELELHWSTAVEAVKAKLISRVDHRRHIQFSDMSEKRRLQLTKSMSMGVRGLSVTRNAAATDLGPSMQAAELWSSQLSDSVVIENDVHRLAQIHLQGEQFTLHRESWPSKAGARCTKAELENLILFTANIPAPSEQMRALQTYLEGVLLAGDGAMKGARK